MLSVLVRTAVSVAKEPLRVRMGGTRHMLLHSVGAGAVPQRGRRSRQLAGVQHCHYGVRRINPTSLKRVNNNQGKVSFRFANVVGVLNLKQSHHFRIHLRRFSLHFVHRRRSAIHATPGTSPLRTVFGAQLIHTGEEQTKLYFVQLEKLWTAGVRER